MRDVRSGSEEETLHPVHEGSDGEERRTTAVGLCPEGCPSLGFTGWIFEMMPW